MIAQAAAESYLEAQSRAVPEVKQEVFLQSKNPGRPLASLFLPLRGALVLTPSYPMLPDSISPDPAPKKKRSPGRPKADSAHDESIQVRLSSKQLARLEEKARDTKMSRAAVIRAALDELHVLPAAPDETLLKERREQYRQLVKLATNLNQLVVLARTAPILELRALATIDQVQQVLAKIHQTLPGA